MKKEILFTKNIDAARKEVEEISGKVTQEFTRQLFAVQLPEDVNPEQLSFSTINMPDDITDTSRLAYNSWKRFEQKDGQKDLAPDHREGLSWNTEGFESPKLIAPLVFADSDLNEIARSTNTPTSLYMTETVAVGLVIVSGNGNLKITTDEAQLLMSEVQEALQFLSSVEPKARLSFIYDIHIVEVEASAGNTNDFESAESPWRNEALMKMGYHPGRQGSVDYVNDLRETKGTKWAYVAYFTKYDLHHFAYAINERLVMNFYNDGWGTEFINRVFAHESCHIFGAADEYGDCSCDSIHGYLGVKNGNCRSCENNRVACLMDKNELALCEWTRKQIGWDTSLFPQP